MFKDQQCSLTTIKSYQIIFVALFLILQILQQVHCISFINFTTTYPNQYIGRVNNTHALVWHTDNILRIYNITFASNDVKNISAILPSPDQLALMDAISISDSGDVMIGALRNILCWYRVSTNFSHCSIGTTLPYNVKALQFTELDNIVIVSMGNVDSYCIVDLNLATPNKTIKYEMLNQTINAFSLVINDLNLYALLNDGKVIFFNLQSWSSNYRLYNYTEIPMLSGKIGRNILGLKGGRYVIVNDYDNSLQTSITNIYDLFNSPPTSLYLSSMSSIYVSMLEKDQTLLFLSGNGSIMEYSKFSFSILFQQMDALMHYKYCTKEIYDGTNYQIVSYKYNDTSCSLFIPFSSPACSSPLSNCLKCVSYNSVDQCTQCNSRFVVNSNNTCSPCSFNCLKCVTMLPKDCLSCQSLYQLTNQTVGCVSICLSNQTRINGSCQDSCFTNCQTCVNTTVNGCLSCNVGYEITNQTVGCVSICLSNQTRINGSCQDSCFTNCQTCVNTTVNGCLSCNVGYEITNQTVGCVSICLSNQTRINGSCQDSCFTNCQTCVNTTVNGCLSCNVGYEITNQTVGCVSICLSNQTRINGICSNTSNALNCWKGFYKDLLLNKCIGCRDECRSCNNSQSCIQFKSYYSVDKNGEGNVDTSLLVATQVIGFPHIKILLNCLSLLLTTTDKLWFYQYHDTTYEDQMTTYFQKIRYIENEKFTPLNSQVIGEWIANKTDFNNFFNFSYYESYSSKTFLKIERVDGTLLHNIQEFLFCTFPTTIVIFLILRFIFYRLFDYPISVYLRQFSFLGTLIMTIIEPNIQYFTFLAANQMLMSFSIQVSMKLIILFWFVVLFVVVMYAVAAYTLYSQYYEKLSKYFILSCYRNDASFIWLTFDIGVKNLVLGLLQSAFVNQYLVKISGLMFVQLSSIFFSIYMWKVYDCFMVKSSHFIRILISALIVLFQFTLIVHYCETNQQLRDLYDTIQSVLTQVMGIMCIVYALTEILIPMLTKKQVQEEDEIEQKNQIQKEQVEIPFVEERGKFNLQNFYQNFIIKKKQKEQIHESQNTHQIQENQRERYNELKQQKQIQQQRRLHALQCHHFANQMQHKKQLLQKKWKQNGNCQLKKDKEELKIVQQNLDRARYIVSDYLQYMHQRKQQDNKKKQKKLKKKQKKIKTFNKQKGNELVITDTQKQKKVIFDEDYQIQQNPRQFRRKRQNKQKGKNKKDQDQGMKVVYRIKNTAKYNRNQDK